VYISKYIHTNIDIRPGDDGDDAMSVASSCIMSIASDISKAELEEFVTNMFETLMSKNRTKKAPRAARTSTGGAAGGPPEPSPAKIAFDNEHKRIETATENITNAIPALTIEELWWVQQHIDEAKIKYDMKCTRINRYKDNVWKYGKKQAAGMTVQSRGPPQV
jgi:hypothetical protein